MEKPREERKGTKEGKWAREEDSTHPKDAFFNTIFPKDENTSFIRCIVYFVLISWHVWKTSKY
ncbi:hypothetical protein JHK87_052828 [Glycine soja]|nr:hypothetical protein JHK87_052828 [Glycine soja]